MREAGAGTNHYSLAHMREKRLSNLEENQGEKTQKQSRYAPESWNVDDDTLRIREDEQKDDPNAWEMDYRDLRALGNNNDPDPEPKPETPANDPQELLESYKQDITANNSTEVEKVGSNLNTDLINNMETTENNQFGSKTFSAVPTADKAAQNFLTDKKQLILNSFK